MAVKRGEARHVLLNSESGRVEQWCERICGIPSVGSVVDTLLERGINTAQIYSNGALVNEGLLLGRLGRFEQVRHSQLQVPPAASPVLKNPLWSRRRNDLAALE